MGFLTERVANSVTYPLRCGRPPRPRSRPTFSDSFSEGVVTRSTFFALAAVGFVSVACSGGDAKRTTDSAAASPSPSTASSGASLTGAGATFPYPIYSKWISDYSAKTGIKINYQAIGSGGGIRQLSEGTVDFGASDAPMTDAEMASAKGGPILHIPTVLGAVVLTYNVPG